jgi:hypothetical protein
MHIKIPKRLTAVGHRHGPDRFHPSEGSGYA